MKTCSFPQNNALRGPVAIGGVGGSGTRVFAEILRGCRFYIGASLNRTLDNLWFTLLFKRPRWVARNWGRDDAEICRALRIFGKAMTVGLSRTAEEHELRHIRSAEQENASYPRETGVFEVQPGDILASVQPLPGEFAGWGWKEPNTHLFLKHLAASFPDLRYIHVLRHGLDMAFSTNRQQLLNWAFLYGLEVEGIGNITPPLMLRYWIAANTRALDVGRALLGDRLLVVRLEDLCRFPEMTTKTLVDFVGQPLDSRKLDSLSRLPALPSSFGRYRNHDLASFPPQDIAAVKHFGYEI